LVESLPVRNSAELSHQSLSKPRWSEFCARNGAPFFPMTWPEIDPVALEGRLKRLFQRCFHFLFFRAATRMTMTRLSMFQTFLDAGVVTTVRHCLQ